MPDPHNNIYPEGKEHAPKAPSDAVEPIFGKEGALYFKHGAFCLETQNYPDAINHVSSSIFRVTKQIYTILLI